MDLLHQLSCSADQLIAEGTFVVTANTFGPQQVNVVLTTKKGYQKGEPRPSTPCNPSPATCLQLTYACRHCCLCAEHWWEVGSMEQPYGQSERRGTCWICIPGASSSLSLICVWHGPTDVHAYALAYVHAYAAGICTTTAGVLSSWFDTIKCFNTATMTDVC